MNKTTEPAALAGIEPVAWQCNAKRRITTEYVYDKRSAKAAEELWNVTPLYSAATVEQLVRERNGWIDSAREFSNGLEYYRDQLDACARHIGLPCFTADDGGIHEEPLRAKVAEEVGRLVQERDKYKDSVEHYGDLYAKLAAMTQECDKLKDRIIKLEDEEVVSFADFAASQAREHQMREMWQKVEAEYFSRLKEQDDLTANFEAEKEMYGWNFHKGLRGGLVEFHIYMTKIAKALSLPQDDTALNQWGAKLLREMADEYRDVHELDVIPLVDLRRKADELEGK